MHVRPQCKACDQEVPVIILFITWGNGRVRNSHVKRQPPPTALEPHSLAASIRNPKGRKVTMSELEGHPVPVWKLGPEKGGDQPKGTQSVSGRVRATWQEPRPRLSQHQHTSPRGPRGQGTNVMHLWNPGREDELQGSILHSANSSQSSLAQGQGLGAAGQWKPCSSMPTSLRKGKYCTASRKKSSSWNCPELSSGSTVRRPPF